jgi:photosystem II stability/assembly factor-like uncharacterized protein
MNKRTGFLTGACLAALVATGNAAWVDISTPLVNSLIADGKTIDYPNGGGCAGVAVNRLNGDVFIKVQGQGIYKSTNQGSSWVRIDGNKVSGRNESAFAWDMDQANPTRMANFSLDGNAGYTADGTAWKTFAQPWYRNWDFGSVDWSDPQAKLIIACAHESGGQVHLSTDGGTTFTQMSLNIVTSGGVDAASAVSMVGVLDANTLIYCKGDGIYRSANRGSAWSKVSTLNTLTRNPKLFKGVAYLGNSSGLLVSIDNGLTWAQKGATLVINQGPYFGADENTMVAVNQQGLYKTTNAGTSWTKLPPTIPATQFPFDPRWPGHFTWDPIHNIAYSSAMGNAAQKWELGTVATVNRSERPCMEKSITISRTSITSFYQLSKVEIFSPSGRLISEIVPQSQVNAIALPQSIRAQKSLLVYRISAVNGSVGVFRQ